MQIFGIRHHGPGSARSLRRALEQLQPDMLLVEGPPDAAGVLPLLTHAAMQPPVALLVYVPDDPRRAAFYPFAIFSPEWQAMRFGLERGIPVRFMDLPQAHQLAMLAEQAPEQPMAESGSPAAGTSEASGPAPLVRCDPLGWLAAAAGYSDGERWWEHMVEQRRDGADIFAAVLEAMSALREHTEPDPDPAVTRREALREAWMRQSIRTALAEGAQRLAVVCGAWHAPALVDGSQADADAALVRGLPRVRTQATWVPWTYRRLTCASGYGAGIEAPGWYDHLWHHPTQVAVRWLARVAAHLREADLDASAAHVIEAVRLAEALAALRDRPLPGLPELNEASRAVLCFGNDQPMQLIAGRLIVGERLGTVPDETPDVPLQQDVQREQRRLRLQPEATWRDIDLDLRKPIDLERSHLLRRLNLLGIEWGTLRSSTGTGTFRERWRLQWEPEFDVALIEASLWGTSVRTAATARALDAAGHADALPALVGVVSQALLADLPEAIGGLMATLQDRAALTSDTGQLMDALIQEDPTTRTSLVSSLRYGNVHQTDAAPVAHVIDGLVTRICIGLPGACAALDDGAAAAMFERIVGVQNAVRLLAQDAHLEAWHAALQRVADLVGIHGLVAGRACRLLYDAGVFAATETARRVGLAVSPGVPAADAAAWIEGLLKDSGTLLVHDQALWAIVDRWVAGMSAETFIGALPLLRRTFATFAAPERRQLGERAVVSPRPVTPGVEPEREPAFDQACGEAVLPIIARLLGIGG